MRRDEQQVWTVSLLLLLAGLALAAVVYWLTGIVFLVVIFAPPLVAYLLSCCRRTLPRDRHFFAP
ncbi:MAG: hypothetical protein NZ473_01285 [Candidatus Kapabacteria bacterium]|nr:hypothetical protein [Candidatus Kapabacteria bacterium]MDW7996307.1 hypothetical protein [Bacteroidota bacterium]MDW8225265.1 hypothetical protein [Bacteroidota bacterium]